MKEPLKHTRTLYRKQYAFAFEHACNDVYHAEHICHLIAVMNNANLMWHFDI